MTLDMTLRAILALSLALLLGPATRPVLASLAESQLQTGLIAYQEGRLKEANQRLNKAVSLDPGLALAHYHLAKIALIQSDPYDAFYSLKETMAITPDFERGRQLLKRLAPQLLTQIDKDLKARRNMAVAYNIMGFLLLNQGRIEEGIKRENFALKQNPELAEAYDDLSWAYYRKGHFPRAYEMAREALKRNPIKASIAQHYRQLFNIQQMGEKASPEGFYRPDPENSTPGSLLSSPDVTDLTSTYRAIDRPRVPEDLAAIHVLSQRTDSEPSSAPLSDAQLKGPSSPAVVDPGQKKIDQQMKELYLKALEDQKTGHREKALQTFSQIAKVDPNYADVTLRIRDIKAQDDTEELYKKLQEWRRKKNWAWVIFTAEEIDLKALKELHNLKSLDNYIGEAHHHMSRHDEAVKYLSRWLFDHPRDTELRHMLVKSLTYLKRYDLALQEYQSLLLYEPEALKRFPELKKMALRLWVKNYFNALLGMAFAWCLVTGSYLGVRVRRGAGKRRLKRLLAQVSAYVKSARWKEVLETLDKIEIRQLSEAERIHLSCIQGTALLEMGDINKTQLIVQELLTRYPDEPAVHHLRARVMLIRREFSPEAVEEYQKLLSVDPNNRILLEALNSYYQNHAPQSEAAFKILDRLLELDPTSADFRYYKALRHLRTGDYSQRAQELYERALETSPDKMDIILALAYCHFDVGRYLESIKVLKGGIDREPTSAKAHKLLIKSYQHLDMLEEGRQEYRRLIEKHPDEPALKEYFKALDRPAEDISSSEISKEKRELKELYEKGVKLFLEGKHKEAIGPLTSVLEVEHLKLSAAALLIRCYLRLQEVKTALALFERLDITHKTPDEFVLNLCYEIAEVYVREQKLERAYELYSFVCRSNVSFKDAFQKLEALETKRKST